MFLDGYLISQLNTTVDGVPNSELSRTFFTAQVSLYSINETRITYHDMSMQLTDNVTVLRCLALSLASKMSLLSAASTHTLCSTKSDAKIEITITTTNLIRIKYPLSSFNYRLSGANVANFNKIHRTVFEHQLFKESNSKTEVSNMEKSP